MKAHLENTNLKINKIININILNIKKILLHESYQN